MSLKKNRFFRRIFAPVIFPVLLIVAENPCLGGTWAPLAHPPPAGLNNSLLLTDGTVICGDGGSSWYRLTPDIHGSYVNGTWTQIASTHYTRLFYSSDVLTNGNVYVAGGEYGTGTAHAELYDSLRNVWSDVPQPPGNPGYSDAISKVITGGNVLQGTTGSGVWIYNPATDAITAAATAHGGQDETCWVKLTNDCILAIDAFGQNTEHYVPSLNQWVVDASTPQDLFGYGGELGPGFLLPNGNVFYIGASTHTGIYTPGSSVTAAGTWVSGPEMVFGGNGLGGVDAPGAMMATGRILVELCPTNGFSTPSTFYEYDYLSNNFTQVNGPTGLTYGTTTFESTMLDLPDGTVLFVGGQGSTSLYVYTPAGAPLAQGQPVINSITENFDGSYLLSGLGLTGISSGAAYGDDWQMDTSYPIVRMTNTSTLNVYYARTFGWNTTSLMTGSRVVTTEFALPLGLPAGTYSLVVTANGIASAPTTYIYSPPSPPTGLTASIGNHQLALSWNSVASASAYDVLRSTSLAGPFLEVATTSGTNYVDTGLTNGIVYYYCLTSVGSGGPSAYSVEISASPFGAPPPPTGLVAGPDSYVGVSLFWNATPGASSYNVKRSNSNGGPYSNIASTAEPNFSDTNVTAGIAYYYVVTAVDAGGESAKSAQAAATPSSSGDVTSGLVANWRFDDGSGTSAADSSGHANTATLVNGPTWIAPGRIGPSALTFLATNLQYATVANASSLDITGPMTMSAWINVIDWGGNRRILQKGNSDNQYRFLAENNVFKFDLHNVNTLTMPLPASNTWVHVVGTWDGSTMTLYTNGQVAASMSASGTIATTSDPLTIGTKNGSSAHGDYFNGTIDEVRLYNRALTLPEINTIMHNGDAAPSAPTGLGVVCSNTQVALSWAGSGSAASYNVKRSTVNGGPYATIASTFAPGYQDNGVTNGVTYYYVVSSVNYNNESANSSQVSATPKVGVTFFVDTFYNGGASQVFGPGNYTLTQLIAGGIGNDVASSCNVPAGWTVVVYQNDNYGGTVWTLTNDTPNFTLFSGLNDNMSSCKITAIATPPAPLNLAAAPGDSQAALSWNSSAGAQYYNVKYSTVSGGPYATLAAVSSTGFTAMGLVNNTTYYFVVSAVDVSGEGPNSGETAVTPMPAPVFLIAVPPTNGVFTFQFQGVDGRNYYTQSSTDLVNWITISTNQTSGSLGSVTNDLSSPALFFRVAE
jgi:fibronectin type 3 domain-containing protein